MNKITQSNFRVSVFTPVQERGVETMSTVNGWRMVGVVWRLALLACAAAPGRVGAAPIPSEKFKVYPIAGRLSQDLYLGNFVDLDPGPGLLDWDCQDFTYDQHRGHDTEINTLGEQSIGVPIFAALDGTVLHVGDGNFDENICPYSPCGSASNYVVIDHGDGRISYYAHMKKDSVMVSVGQQVRAGEQIGEAGSSGNSAGPHLHWETVEYGTVLEPMSGPCRLGDSGFASQPVVDQSLFVSDFGLTYDLSLYAGRPYPFPRSGQIALTDERIGIWFILHNTTPQDIRLQFQRPDATIALDTTRPLFNSRTTLESATYDVLDMGTITGTWTVLVDIGGIRVVDAPIEVVAERTDGFKRAPEPISVSFEPSVPTPNDVVNCLIDTDIMLNDLDYDLLSYHYVWTVDSLVVRDVTTAALSDVLPHSTATNGSTVECTVTPSDSTTDGPTASVSITVDPATGACCQSGGASLHRGDGIGLCCPVWHLPG